jgi:NRPS condensation-like uncharacterized protein
MPLSPSQLPFTVIDEAVHVLDTPAEPWGIELELALSGRLDPDRLRGAVATALAAHPLARARLLPARWSDRSRCWAIAPEADVEPVRAVECPDGAALDALRAERLSRQVPLAEAPPFRLVLARNEAGDHLLLNANHAAFDGFGCLRLLHSIARAYAGEPDTAPPVRIEEARDLRRLLAAGDARARRRRWRMVASKAADVVVGPARIAPEDAEDAPGYAVHHAALSPAETERLGARRDATVNDVLVAGLHLAVQRWNDERAARTGRVSTLVPVNLRPGAWREDVVTNFVLDARVVTSRAQRADPQTLLRVVAEQGDRIKNGGGAALMDALGGWRPLPLWAKELLSPMLRLTGNRLVDTAVVSNLGVIEHPPGFGAGAGDVEHGWFSAPTRMPCGVSVGAATVGGRLHLSVRSRRPVLGNKGAAAFSALFLATLEEITES